MELTEIIKDLDVSLLRILSIDWFEVLAKQQGIEFSSSQEAPDRITLGPTKDGLQVDVEIAADSLCRFRGNDPAREELIDSLARDAINLALAGDAGGYVWHHIQMKSVELVEGPGLLAGMLQMFSSQRRINCWTRLPDSLLEFIEEETGETRPLVAPKTTVNLYLRVPGPKLGRFLQHFGNNAVEMFSAICAFALGRRVERPDHALYTKTEQWPDLEARYADPSIPYLARNGVALDFIHNAPLPGAVEFITRVETALITFEAALGERNNGVACILYVVAAESLCVPNSDLKWKKEKTTDRFISFYEELMPTELDKIVAHGNFEEIFAIKRGKKKTETLRRLLLDAVYAFRSGLVHGGLGSTPRTYLPNFFQGGIDVRRSVFMDFAEAAILKYLQAPRCSTVASPMDVKDPNTAKK